MTTLHADTKAAATKTREQRPATGRDEAPQEKPAPRARTLESHELESYNLPFTD
jgi:hypothetical protein